MFIGFSLFDLLTWPVIILGLFRGSYQTFKVLDSKDDAKKREMLEYWVVLNALIFVLPWLDSFLGWFLFSGIIGLLKCALLLMVVISRKNFGFIYKLIEEQFMALIEPYIMQGLEMTVVYRQHATDAVCLVVNSLHQYLLHILVSEMSDSNLAHLKKRLRKTMEIVKREELAREKGDLRDDTRQRSKGKDNNDSSRDGPMKSIFEDATDETTLKKRKTQS